MPSGGPKWSHQQPKDALCRPGTVPFKLELLTLCSPIGKTAPYAVRRTSAAPTPGEEAFTDIHLKSVLETEIAVRVLQAS
jgi:hypothetical protein